MDKIDVMLDYDMLASAELVRFVYDGDGDADQGNPAGPEGSGVVEQVFDDWFDAQGLASERVPFDGRSDYVGFTDRGIPAGGVFAGAEGVKTAEEEAVYGGAAGSWYDPCYHQLCDNLTTVLTGVPPLDAEGLAPDGDDAAKAAAQGKMAGGALKSLSELSGAASYAVYYFAASKDPFGTKPKKDTPPRASRTSGKATATASTAKEIVHRGAAPRGGAHHTVAALAEVSRARWRIPDDDAQSPTCVATRPCRLRRLAASSSPDGSNQRSQLRPRSSRRCGASSPP